MGKKWKRIFFPTFVTRVGSVTRVCVYAHAHVRVCARFRVVHLHRGQMKSAGKELTQQRKSEVD